MEIAALDHPLPQPRVTASGIHVSLYIRLAFYITVGAAILTLAVIVLARHEALANPFSLYLDMLPGRSPSAVVERECGSARQNLPGATCTISPTSGAFSRIVVTANGSIVSTTFNVRQQSVRVGELMVLWGKPTIQIRGGSATLSWSRPGAVASVTLPQNHRFNYFLPVGSVLFS